VVAVQPRTDVVQVTVVDVVDQVKISITSQGLYRVDTSVEAAVVSPVL
jgi:hypothetical protein